MERRRGSVLDGCPARLLHRTQQVVSEVRRRQILAQEFVGWFGCSPPGFGSGPSLSIGTTRRCEPAPERSLNFPWMSTVHEDEDDNLDGAIISWICAGVVGWCFGHRIFL